MINSIHSQNIAHVYFNGIGIVVEDADLIGTTLAWYKVPSFGSRGFDCIILGSFLVSCAMKARICFMEHSKAPFFPNGTKALVVSRPIPNTKDYQLGPSHISPQLYCLEPLPSSSVLIDAMLCIELDQPLIATVNKCLYFSALLLRKYGKQQDKPLILNPFLQTIC